MFPSLISLTVSVDIKHHVYLPSPCFHPSVSAVSCGSQCVEDGQVLLNYTLVHCLTRLFRMIVCKKKKKIFCFYNLRLSGSFTFVLFLSSSDNKAMYDCMSNLWAACDLMGYGSP